MTKLPWSALSLALTRLLFELLAVREDAQAAAHALARVGALQAAELGALQPLMRRGLAALPHVREVRQLCGRLGLEVGPEGDVRSRAAMLLDVGAPDDHAKALLRAGQASVARRVHRVG